MSERIATLTVDALVGVATTDVGKLVNILMTLILSPKHCSSKCRDLATKVDQVYSSIRMIDHRGSTYFDAAKYGKSLSSFRQVVQDSIDLVERYQNRSIFVKLFMSLKLEDDFDSLRDRLDSCMRNFDFNMQVNNTISTGDVQKEVQVFRDEMSENLKQIKSILEGNQGPEDCFLSGVTFGDEVVGGLVISGRLNDFQDVILIACHQETKETAIMKRLSECPNILQFFGRCQRQGIVYAVMERPGSIILTLDELISEGKVKSDWRLKRMIALDTALGIGYAHAAEVLHKTLRSPNIFLTDACHPKIFGFMQGRIKADPSSKKFNDSVQVRWAAPEMLKKDRPQYNEKCDIFSLGVVLWELITNQEPFSDIQSLAKVIVARTKQGKRLEFLRYKGRGSDALEDFIRISEDCMETDPQHRPDIATVIDRLSRLVPEEMHTREEL